MGSPVDDVEAGIALQDREKTSEAARTAGPFALVRNETRAITMLRAILIAILVLTVIGTATATYKLFSKAEQDQFASDFEAVATRITEAFLQGMSVKMWNAYGAIIPISNMLQNGGNLTGLTVSNFDDLSPSTRASARAGSAIWSPLVRNAGERAAWEAAATARTNSGTDVAQPCYICGSRNREPGAPDAQLVLPGYGVSTCSNLDDALRDAGAAAKPSECQYVQMLAESKCECQASSSDTETWVDNRTVEQGMFCFSEGVMVDEPGPGPYSPIWQIAPTLGREQSIMFNQMSNPLRSRALQSMIKSKLPVVSEIILDRDDDFNRLIGYRFGGLSAALFYPVLDDRSEVIGSIALDFSWTSVLDLHYPPRSTGVVVVLENTCGEAFTFQIGDSGLRELGEGDLHSPRFEPFREMSTYESYSRNRRSASPLSPSDDDEDTTDCLYRVKVYPCHVVEQYYITNKPMMYTVFVTLMFVFTAMVFIGYDCVVRKRQNKVMDSAIRTDAIVSSLFPDAVRDRLIRRNAGTGAGSRKRKKFMPRLETPKVQLQSFLANSRSYGDCLQPGSEPIADFFSRTTVLFADIAGFTAWSSEREPSQVFTLLETVYNSFDELASRTGIFKVETIGDCYVAVSGLPEPRDDHAVAMAEFACQIVIEMQSLSRRLEASLGPGTADLSIRIGLHSGPVTAGVLRGAKSRFQLFGDTMNTASRMESTGTPGRIQVSAETADLLVQAGKDDWLTRRDELVTVKGKGDLQTYWVNQSNTVYRRLSSTRNCSSDGVSLEEEEQVHGAVWGNASLEETLSTSPKLEKRKRMVEWNVDVLLAIIKKVVAKRQAEVNRATFRANRVSRNSSMTTGAIAVLQHESDPESISLGTKIRLQLQDYVERIADLYLQVPFHNFEHASHVTMSANKLMKRIVRPDDVEYKTKSKRPRKQHKSLARELHKSTFGISSDPLMQLAVVFSALVHDVKHPGIPNSQLVKEGDPVSLKYNGESVLENQSVECALNMLMDARYAELQACVYDSDDECTRFHELVVTAIISTDIADKELNNARKSRWNQVFHTLDDSPNNDTEVVKRKSLIVFEHIIQASDVAHTMQHWHIYLKWNERLFEERYSAFLAGRAEDPSTDWYKGEIAFFDYYVIPLARKLEESGVFGVSSDEYLNYALENRSEWELKGEAITKQMVARHCQPTTLKLDINTNEITLRRPSLNEAEA